MRKQLSNIQQIFLQECQANNCMKETDPEKLFGGVREAMEQTRAKVSSQCFGNKNRIDACNALFREAQTGVELAKETLILTTFTQEVPGKPEGAEPQDVKKPEYLSLALLLAGFCCCFFALKFQLLLPVALLAIGVALVLEGKKLLENMDFSSAVKLAMKLIPNKKLRKWAEKVAAGTPQEENAKEPAPTGEIRMTMDADAILKACLSQLAVIEQNLPIFQPPVIQKDQNEELWSLVRTLLQEKYAAHTVFPPAVENELEMYLEANEVELIDYSEDTAHLFHTQAMNETFTMFPAVIRSGQLEEYGLAGVKEV